MLIIESVVYFHIESFLNKLASADYDRLQETD